MEEVLTLSESARLLSISEPTARELFRTGKIQGARAGRQWRTTPSALRSLQRSGGATQPLSTVLSQTLDEDERDYHFLLSMQPRHKTAPPAFGMRCLRLPGAPCEWHA
jgi:excisionase family DNA binding protein